MSKKKYEKDFSYPDAGDSELLTKIFKKENFMGVEICLPILFSGKDPDCSCSQVKWYHLIFKTRLLILEIIKIFFISRYGK